MLPRLPENLGFCVSAWIKRRIAADLGGWAQCLVVQRFLGTLTGDLFTFAQSFAFGLAEQV